MNLKDAPSIVCPPPRMHTTVPFPNSSRRSLFVGGGGEAGQVGEPGVANVLLGVLALGAVDGLGVLLALEGAAGVAGALGVHGLLEGVALPAEQVVAVDAHARLVAHAPEEGLAAVGRPVLLVVELPGVEHDLVHDLRDLDRVRSRARAARLEGARGRVGDVRLVVGRVERLAVPARREGDGHAPAAAARRLGELAGVGPGAGRAAEGRLLHVMLAAVAEATRDGGRLAVGGVTDQHAETLE
jgi:hypothetical protein